jgi:DNA (cytosine-5)-methyltransferase 1
VAPPVTSNPYGDHKSREGLLVATTSGPGWWNETETAGALRSSTGGGDGALNATLVAFGGNNTRGPIDVATAVNAHGGPCGRMDFESETFIAHALRGTAFDASEDGTGRGTPIVSVAFDTTQITSPSNYSNPKPGDPCHPLASTQHPPAIAGSAVRRLTPRECERLQGFPDDWTLVPWRKAMASDGPRYAAIGNSMPVPVMAWIGRRIAGQMPDA